MPELLVSEESLKMIDGTYGSVVICGWASLSSNWTSSVTLKRIFRHTDTK